jgi:hypothetical protein
MINLQADTAPNFFQAVADFRADCAARQSAGFAALLRLAFGGGAAAARAAMVLQDTFASLGLRVLDKDGEPVAPPADTTDSADKADKGEGAAIVRLGGTA